ncbi:MAG: glycogen debranching protein GlgX [Candidatus Aminicenantes bacterium]|nr:MAG: glycogen debranching protein GlgX [Candidatus Aminicenantes bacterium]
MKFKELEFFSGYPRRMPYGANIDAGGVHFSIFSRHATRVWLLLFDSPHDDSPRHEVELVPGINRTGDVWHVWVKGLGPGQLYLWRMDGPYEPEKGHRFNPEFLLLDPYARAVTGNYYWNAAHPGPVRYQEGKGAKDMPKCVVCSDKFDWERDRPLNRPLSETVIYECHVRGLTAHKSANVEYPGTFKGVVEKIPYFKSLGITALELLPVQEFGVFQEDRENPLTGEKLSNYWGYNTVGFFAPNGGYSASGTMGQQVNEFKWMVRELHRAGIEVILDVVFNHTAEGNEKGPTFCFKGIDNRIYYMLDPMDGSYLDYTGCGNTFNCNHPVVRDFIISCLYYWVLYMHVDGFRFDLASVLGRDERGNLLPNPPLLERIEEYPILRGTKIIAEAWDAAGAYQVGEFTGRWAEWNGKFRDDVRRFWRGDPGSVSPLATRFAGSSDLYGDNGRTPHHSINFITSHDGFTLNDWASYERKHNLANGHDNQDGDEQNLSINHGVEGPTTDPQIDGLRERQIKNMLATLILSLGVPMILGGDEFRRTQKGNNNPYCQNNEISWFDWTLTGKNPGMVRFTRELIHFLKRHPTLRRQSFYPGKLIEEDCLPGITWYGDRGQAPDWDGNNLCLAVLIKGERGIKKENTDTSHDIFIMFNANLTPRTFHIPRPSEGGVWKITINTQNPSPGDIYSPGNEPELGKNKTFALKEQSLAVLVACQLSRLR